jgi:hypothetical protein
MQTALMIAIALHALSSVFWAGTTFALARSQGQGAEQLRKPQLGAALVAIVSGAVLGHLTHAGAFGGAERVLAAGAAAALIAAVIQLVTFFRAGRAAPASPVQGNTARGQRIAAGLLAVTLLCMVLARYAG